MQVPSSCVPVPTDGELAALPPQARPIDHPHLTLLRGQSMAPLVGRVDPQVLRRLPPFPAPTFAPGLFVATRGPHPEKDPPGDARPRKTWFRSVQSQAQCHALLRAILAILRAEGAPWEPHPEPHRWFHLSCWNNRDGDGMRSIGDIGPADQHPAIGIPPSGSP